MESFWVTVMYHGSRRRGWLLVIFTGSTRRGAASAHERLRNRRDRRMHHDRRVT